MCLLLCAQSGAELRVEETELCGFTAVPLLAALVVKRDGRYHTLVTQAPPSTQVNHKTISWDLHSYEHMDHTQILGAGLVMGMKLGRGLG